MDDLSDAKVQKVGAALREVTRVREDYGARLTAAETDEERQVLQNEAQAVMIEAVRGQDLSVIEFSEVIEAAEDDPTVRDRVLTAASLD
jgi:ribosomal protein S12